MRLAWLLVGAVALFGCDDSDSDDDDRGAGGSPALEACAVRLFDEERFKRSDDQITITEPGRYPNLRNLPGAREDWTGEADSLQVGTGATVTVWDQTDFAGASREYGPGEQDPNIVGEVRSLELNCD